MVKMMKKGVVCTTFAAVLLVMAALIIGCSTPESSGGGEKGYKPPPGMGAVKLNFNDTVRSIAPGTTITSFTKFDIEFNASGGGGVDASFHDIPAASVTGPYDLTPGIYSIEVVGYIGSGDAAVGTVVGQTIAANTTTPTDPITLVAYDPVTDGGTGTFSWNITSTVHDLTSARMSFTRIQPTGSVPPLPPVPGLVDFIENTGKWTNSITTFPAGYYWVDFVLIAKSTTRTFRHILIIYKNQTTSFSYLFDDSYFIYAKAELPPIVYPPFDDKKPVLEYDDDGTAPPLGVLVDGNTVTVSITGAGDPASIAMEVTNQGIYTTIQWFLNSIGPTALSSGVSGSNGEILTVDTSVAPFKVQGLYQLTVVGTASGVPYSTIIYLEILP